jgi:para-nitrobenzyl esterase
MSDDYKVSATMEAYFANFIINGNPKSGSLPNWPAAKAGDNDPDIMVTDVDSKSVKATHDDRYRFLDKGCSSKK